jgi:hypothetical protein
LVSLPSWWHRAQCLSRTSKASFATGSVGTGISADSADPAETEMNAGSKKPANNSLKETRPT